MVRYPVWPLNTEHRSKSLSRWTAVNAITPTPLFDVFELLKALSPRGEALRVAARLHGLLVCHDLLIIHGCRNTIGVHLSGISAHDVLR